jgi:hypothetical protein
MVILSCVTFLPSERYGDHLFSSGTQKKQRNVDTALQKISIVANLLIFPQFSFIILLFLLLLRWGEAVSQ